MYDKQSHKSVTTQVTVYTIMITRCVDGHSVISGMISFHVHALADNTTELIMDSKELV